MVGGVAVSTMSNLNPSYIELELGLGFDNIVIYDLLWFLIHWIRQLLRMPLEAGINEIKAHAITG